MLSCTFMRPGMPDYLRKLHDQRDRLQLAKAESVKAQLERQEADMLRREIRELGEEPCA